jgi:hypothetical protein
MPGPRTTARGTRILHDSHSLPNHSKAVGAPVMPMCPPRPYQSSQQSAATTNSIKWHAFVNGVANDIFDNMIIQLPCFDRGGQSIQEGHCHIIDATLARANSTAICDPALAGLQFQPARHRKICKLHQPGIEPGSHQWQRCILPLDH